MTRDNAPSGSGRTALAVALAAVFLAVIGGSAGVIVGMRELRAERFAPVDGQVPGPPSSPVESQPPASGGSGGYRDTCPPPTVSAVAAAGGGSVVGMRRYVETKLSQVWICVGRDGQLWYQGHRKGPGDRRYPDGDLVEGQNALLIRARAVTEDGYEAFNGGTKYTVSRDNVTITNPDGSQQVEPAVDAFP
ncbi:MAG TPA: hypothetical protein VK453_07400 [Micromonosporaceae bacterium]|nr:hypothetical protein [Micromonosporaceae bacterium]